MTRCVQTRMVGSNAPVELGMNLRPMEELVKVPP